MAFAFQCGRGDIPLQADIFRVVSELSLCGVLHLYPELRSFRRRRDGSICIFLWDPYDILLCPLCEDEKDEEEMEYLFNKVMNLFVECNCAFRGNSEKSESLRVLLLDAMRGRKREVTWRKWTPSLSPGGKNAEFFLSVYTLLLSRLS